MATKNNKAEALSTTALLSEVNSLKAALAAESKVNAAIAEEFNLFNNAVSNKMLEKFPNGLKDKFFWIIANWSSILELIRFIIKEVQAVKERIAELRK